jgi:hypothetical protein
MINKYNPDLLYFDDTALPLWPVSDAGLRIAADFYNSNIKKQWKAGCSYFWEGSYTRAKRVYCLGC